MVCEVKLRKQVMAPSRAAVNKVYPREAPARAAIAIGRCDCHFGQFWRAGTLLQAIFNKTYPNREDTKTAVETCKDRASEYAYTMSDDEADPELLELLRQTLGIGKQKSDEISSDTGEQL